MNKTDRYIPALGVELLTPLYDPLLRWFMRESRFKRHLIRQANIQKELRVLDLGCGTGTLTVLLKQFHPEAEVFGLDGDRSILEIARTKAVKAGVDLNLDLGMAFDLPYPDACFDRVLSSLVFHHLTKERKQLALKEVYRVLRPGGELHLADFGKPHNSLAFLISLIVRRFEETTENIQGLIPEMLAEAQFAQVQETAHYMTIFGTLSLFQGRKNEEGANIYEEEIQEAPRRIGE